MNRAYFRNDAPFLPLPLRERAGVRGVTQRLILCLLLLWPIMLWAADSNAPATWNQLSPEEQKVLKPFQERWDTLPQNLKEAIFSPANADIIWKFCENNHVTEEKIRVIATVGGDVLMGFLHPDPEDVAREIEERAKIPKPLALDIARELERKIFLPLNT